MLYATPCPVGPAGLGERRLVILGPPGSGKSTLVRCLALALAADDERRPLDPGLPETTVPLLLPLKTYAARLRNDGSFKLDAFLRDELADHLPDLDEILENGRARVLLDGHDALLKRITGKRISGFDREWVFKNRSQDADETPALPAGPCHAWPPRTIQRLYSARKAKCDSGDSPRHATHGQLVLTGARA